MEPASQPSVELLHPFEVCEPDAESTACSSLGGVYPASAWSLVRTVGLQSRDHDHRQQLRSQRFLYTACYCEENCHRLLPTLVERSLASIDELFVVFVSNSSKQVVVQAGVVRGSKEVESSKTSRWLTAAQNTLLTPTASTVRRVACLMRH